MRLFSSLIDSTAQTRKYQKSPNTRHDNVASSARVRFTYQDCSSTGPRVRSRHNNLEHDVCDEHTLFLPNSKITTSTRISFYQNKKKNGSISVSVSLCQWWKHGESTENGKNLLFRYICCKLYRFDTKFTN